MGDVEEAEKEEIRYQINTKNSIERTKMKKKIARRKKRRNKKKGIREGRHEIPNHYKNKN